MHGGVSRWNPLAGVARSWGHFTRRPRATQIRTVAMVGAVLVGTSVWVASAPSSASPPTATARPRRLDGRPGSGRPPVEPGQHLHRGG